MRYVVFVTLMLGMSATAKADGPTQYDTDLHAVYCIPIVNQLLAAASQLAVELPETSSGPLPDVNASTVRAAIASLKSARDRLRAYVLPLIEKLPADAFLLANSRGQTDIAAELRVYQTCTVEHCEGNDPERSKRISACRNPTWLPF